MRASEFKAREFRDFNPELAAKKYGRSHAGAFTIKIVHTIILTSYKPFTVLAIILGKT